MIGAKCTIYRNMELFGNLSFSSRHGLLVLLPSFTSSSLFSAFAKECVRWRLILYYTMFAFPPAFFGFLWALSYFLKKRVFIEQGKKRLLNWDAFFLAYDYRDEGVK